MTCECRDGLVFTKDAKGYSRVYRCHCPLGQKHSGSMFLLSDKNKERPIELAQYRPPVVRTAGIEKRVKED